MILIVLQTLLKKLDFLKLLSQSKSALSRENEIELNYLFGKKFDYIFHRTLISECGSRNLLEIHSNLYDRYRRYQIILQQNRGKDSENEHYEIFQAALNRDINKANKYLEIHLIKGIENIIDLALVLLRCWHIFGNEMRILVKSIA